MSASNACSTNIRFAMLTSAAAGEDCGEDLLGFYAAIARQCFINEYVYSVAEAEAETAQRLRAALDAALANGDTCPALWPVVVGAYFPLHSLANAQALLDRSSRDGSWPKALTALLIQQIKEPAEERRIAAAMPALTGVDDEVSRAVRRQYEESPYPRWVAPDAPAPPASPTDPRSAQRLDVLIAGCGTGMSTIEFARHAPGARILALDLSLASLSYAKRMAQKFGLAAIEFAQADIMKLGAIGRTLTSSIVPACCTIWPIPGRAGACCCRLLRPGGVMQLGLYSEAARQNIVAARTLIAERGYQPVAQDIRRCREEIMAAGAEPLLQSLLRSSDFFTTSECRDLLFHVQDIGRRCPHQGFLGRERNAISRLPPRPCSLAQVRGALSGPRGRDRSRPLARVRNRGAHDLRGDVSVPNTQAHSGASLGRHCGCRRQRLLVAAQPVTRRALRGRNVDIRHLVGDLAAQADRVEIALHRRKIEPLMRGDEIDRHVTADRIHHAELEKHVACRRALAERSRIAVENFKPSHLECSPVPCLRPLRFAACAARRLFPPADTRIILRRFEWWFKQCDE